MNTEERDFQIEDGVDFGLELDTEVDLTPDVADFEIFPKSIETPDSSGNVNPADPTSTDQDQIDLGEYPNTREEEKENTPTNPRVMRYEDFIKNI